LEGQPRSIGSAEQPVKIGGLQPVELNDTKPIRAGEVGRQSSWSAEQPAKAEGSQASAARGGSGSESCRFTAGGAGGRDSRLYHEFIKIGTPEASVSGVFNLCRFFAGYRVRFARRMLGTCLPLDKPKLN
jgi:hypothetical protein